jgi:hypothetical protein
MLAATRVVYFQVCRVVAAGGPSSGAPAAQHSNRQITYRSEITSTDFHAMYLEVLRLYRIGITAM